MSSLPTLSIRRSVLRLVETDGQHSYPEECCGFLFGTENGLRRDVVELLGIRNEQESNRTRRFLISPEHFRQAEQHASATKLDLLGFYHSHPDHPAVPSEFDREHALPVYSYLIVSVRAGQAAETRSWQLDPDRGGYTEEEVKVAP